MATSGTRAFNPDLGEITAEAFERCLIRAKDLTTEHVQSALRSANFLLAEWNARGFKQFELADATFTTVTGQASYSLPVGTLGIWLAYLRRNGLDEPMYLIGRQDYADIADKSLSGRPDRIFLDTGATGTAQRTAYLWPTPENSTDVVRYVALRRPEDVTDLIETAPVAYEWIEAFTAGLAAKLSTKWAPQRKGELQAEADQAYMIARGNDRERAPLILRVTQSGRMRGR